MNRHVNIGIAVAPGDPCHQRAIRDAVAAVEPRPILPRLVAPTVKVITSEHAKEIILKYEWLGTMGRSVICVGLFDSGELLGVVCFGWPGSNESRGLCGDGFRDKAICLERGACVHWAPKNAGSYLVRHACALVHKLLRYSIFYAYSDEDAGEIGTIYQACNWLYLGQGIGRTPGRMREYFEAPDGKILASRTLRHRKLTKRQVLALGWVVRYQKPKHKYAWFEGDRRERRALRAALRYEPKPYPKRQQPMTLRRPT
jgi:hypothetical protein